MDLREYLPSMGELVMFSVVLFIPLCAMTASLIDKIRQLSLPCGVKLGCLFLIALIEIALIELT